jgi:hypothetical protein
VLKTSNVAGSTTLIEEIGHCFNLLHTRSSNEHTTRNPNDTLFNATTAGDRIVDTAANSGFSLGGTYLYLDENCEYIAGFEQDNHGVDYDISPEDVDNSMGDAGDCEENYLTGGQAIRMREAINDDIYGKFSAAETTIASLYEPYKGEYYFSGPALPESSKPLFQPGFDFSFIECSCANIDTDCNVPIDYNNTSFQNNHTVISSFGKYDTDYNNMTHPNHTAILIDQLDTNQPRKCYDNWNKAAESGSITKFNDGVLNANVTITPQDSLSINNPNLLNDLPNGLYKIEKNYNDGSSQETVIIKGNN